MMKCIYCGEELKEGSLYCPKCGKAVQIVPDYNIYDDDYLNQVLTEESQKISGSRPDRNKRPAPAEKKHPGKKHLDPRQKKIIFLVLGIVCVLIFALLILGAAIRSNHANSFDYQVGLAEKTGIDLPYMTAIVVGGSFFGDNLSFISDTTIASTKTQDCVMRDKFKINFMIVVPAALVVLGIYVIQGLSLSAVPQIYEIEWIKVIPYLIVLGTAITGVNVMVVLLLGIVSTGIIGICTATGVFGVTPAENMNASTAFFDWFGAMGTGITGMGELIIITLLAGGMLETIRYNGGIDFVITRLTRHVTGKRGAEFSIAALVSVANLCTANNTIAIITTGPIAKDIALRFHLDRRKTASILDTFSCLVQGIIPYGAQMLIASGLAGISPISIIGNLYYPFCMGTCAILAILLRYPRKYSGEG